MHQSDQHVPPEAQYGSPSGFGPERPPLPRSRRPRTGLIATGTGITGLLIGLVVGIAATGTDPSPAAPAASGSTSQEPDTKSSQGTTDAAEPTSPTDTEAAKPEATPEPAPTTAQETAKAAGDGTRNAPFKIGTEVSSDDWTVKLGKPREAWSDIKAENMFNDPPPSGYEYYMLPVTATYTGPTSATAWLGLRFSFVGDDGVTYTDSCGVIPNDLDEVGELYEGGVAKGNICITVPKGAKGLWTTAETWGDPTFFTVKR